MKFTKDEVLKMVDELAKNNHKVRSILKHNGSYDNIPDFQKELIHKALGVKMTVIVEYSTLD